MRRLGVSQTSEPILFLIRRVARKTNINLHVLTLYESKYQTITIDLFSYKVYNIFDS